MRLFVEPADCLFGDTLMQTPALRALRAANPGAEIVYVAPPGSLAELALRGNPAIDRFISEGSGTVLFSWQALEFAIQNHASFYEGFAAQLDVSIDSKSVDFHLDEEERRAGEALIQSFGPPHKVVVCGRHSTSCVSNRVSGSPPNKCFPNEVWIEVAEWLIELGYVPLAVGAANEADDPASPPGPAPGSMATPCVRSPPSSSARRPFFASTPVSASSPPPPAATSPASPARSPSGSSPASPPSPAR